jgi:type IV pilus assembly protein PilF
MCLLAGCASTGTGGSGSSELPRARKVDREAQDSAALQVKLGQGYLTEGELETARDKLKRALELDPNSVDAHTLMAVLSERINRPKAAEQFYRKAAELKPEDGSVNNNYGAFLCGSGRFEEAEPYFQKAFDDPFYRTPAVAYTNAGMCALKANRVDRAESYLRQAIELQPRNAVALFELSRLHLAKNDLMRARAFLQRYEAAREVADPEALNLGAVIEERAGNPVAASEYRQRLSTEFPQFTPPADKDEGSPP